MSKFTLQVTGGSGNSNTDGTFINHGNVTKDGKKVLVYGAKAEDEERAPQTRRALNQATIEHMIRGKLKVGTPGVNALTPFEGRKSVDISNWGHEDSPYRTDFINACKNVASEVDEAGVDVPEWFSEALETELASA